MIDNTKIAAYLWVDKLYEEKGIDEARAIMTYNVTKNRHFNESAHWVTMAWHRIHQIESEIYSKILHQ